MSKTPRSRPQVSEIFSDSETTTSKSRRSVKHEQSPRADSPESSSSEPVEGEPPPHKYSRSMYFSKEITETAMSIKEQLTLRGSRKKRFDEDSKPAVSEPILVTKDSGDEIVRASPDHESRRASVAQGSSASPMSPRSTNSSSGSSGSGSLRRISNVLTVRKRKDGFSGDAESAALTMTQSLSSNEVKMVVLASSPAESSVRVSVPKAEDLSAEDLQELSNHRTMIARELHTTEKYYVHVLEILVDVYQAEFTKKAKEERPLISEEMLPVLFINLNRILTINKQLLEDIEARVNDWSDTQVMGDIFARMGPYLKMYNTYGSGYDRAIECLNKLNKNAQFVDFVQQLDATTDLTARFETLLISPVQRIPRYILLLEQMLKSTPDTHPDHVHLLKAIPMLQEVTDYLNNNITAQENLKKLMDYARSGARKLLQPHRVLIKDGVIYDENRKKKYLFLLCSDILVHISESKAKGNRALLEHPRFQCPINLIWFSRPNSDCFEIAGPRFRYTIKTTGSAAAEREQWAAHFERVIGLVISVQRGETISVRYGAISFRDGSVYSGGWKNAQMHGEGQWAFWQMTYKGGFDRDQKSGHGEMTYVGGDVYEGQWANDLPNGQGTMKFANGDEYVGEWHSGRRHGSGQLCHKNGAYSYDGDWQHDVPHGPGTLKFHDGTVYSGDWQHGLRHGSGSLTMASGLHYEGDWERDRPSGKGHLDYGDGRLYDGRFRDGKRHGRGVFVDAIGRYDGSWHDDKKSGLGHLDYASGKTYDGQWQNDLFHGLGDLTFKSGPIKFYKGEWEAGKRSGRGILKFATKLKYDGNWADDMPHGQGALVYTNKSRLEGKFVSGRLEGKCTLRIQVGGEEQSYVGVFRDGWLVSKKNPPIPISALPNFSFWF